MLAVALAQAIDELHELPKNARRLLTSIARAAELDSIVEVQGVVIERLCARVASLEVRLREVEDVMGKITLPDDGDSIEEIEHHILTGSSK